VSILPGFRVNPMAEEPGFRVKAGEPSGRHCTALAREKHIWMPAVHLSE
jgi:hypothetical protein